MTLRQLSLAVAMTASLSAGAAPAPAPVPVVVELFTSEGCSSCPPADVLLAEITKTQPVPGALVIGLSEHVDYWDNLGWKDPFSSAALTGRQSDYASAMNTSDIYTPQIVVGGAEAVVGSDRKAVLDAIAHDLKRAPKPLALAWQPDGRLSVTAAPGSAKTGDRVWLAIAENSVRRQVTAGENSGHALDHVSVARRISSIGTVGADGGYRSVSAVALDPAWHAGPWHVVVFIQRGKGGPIVAAAMTEPRNRP